MKHNKRKLYVILRLLEFKVTAHSYFEVITAHLLARYYIHTKDFELAFYHS